ncbi:MAG: acyl-CoA desaturase [Bacteroidota bacterium]|nr:acyl-CoA desaturase [Bacteroidota bacterium]MDP3144611.1 acyl-CoA desaturase [Bacteroidota bacterium]MDP3556550.1 acyl-CoA desaturase [Bacteroidota bacterium]
MTSTNQKTFPRFVPKEKSIFFPTLQKRVNQYFKDNNISKNANSTMVIKTIVLLAAFIVPVLMVNLMFLNTWLVVVLYSIMGFALAGIGMSIMHDSNHGAYSKNQYVNNWLGYSLNLIGGMVFNWKLQHNVLHHTYPNIHNLDDDIADKLVLRFSPHSTAKKFHRFQFIYVFFFYSILTLYWALAKDFIQYFKYIKEGTNRFTKSENIKYFISMVFLKLLFFTYMIILPIVFQGYSVGLIISGFLIMQAIGGLVLGLVFQLAHSVEEAEFPLPNDLNIIENDWAVHQMRTTVNFARNNKLLSWYVGGLNFQVEHHLFPNICHVHYPQISKIVEETANEFNVPYLCAPTIKQAFASHLGMLKKLGFSFNLDLAKM